MKSPQPELGIRGRRKNGIRMEMKSIQSFGERTLRRIQLVIRVQGKRLPSPPGDDSQIQQMPTGTRARLSSSGRHLC